MAPWEKTFQAEISLSHEQHWLRGIVAIARATANVKSAIVWSPDVVQSTAMHAQSQTIVHGLIG